MGLRPRRVRPPARSSVRTEDSRRARSAQLTGAEAQLNGAGPSEAQLNERGRSPAAARYDERSGATSYPPSSEASARSKRAGSSVCSVSSGWPSRTWSPGLGVPDDAGAGLHRVLLARATGPEPPGGDADGQRVQPGQHARRPARRRRGSPAPPAARHPGRRPAPAIIARQASIAVPVGRARSAGSTSSRPAPASISRASARVSSTTSAGPPPASTSTDSRTSSALPAVEAERRRTCR